MTRRGGGNEIGRGMRGVRRIKVWTDVGWRRALLETRSVVRVQQRATCDVRVRVHTSTCTPGPDLPGLPVLIRVSVPRIGRARCNASTNPKLHLKAQDSECA